MRPQPARFTPANYRELRPDDDLFGYEFNGDGNVYLIHLTKPLERKNALVCHYIGYTEDLNRRLWQHLKCQNGSPLIHAALQRGSGLIVSCVWTGVNQRWERFLKDRKNAKRFCPICHGLDCREYPETVPF
jgi:hypothetical protein